MPIWKITGKGPAQVPETELTKEKVLEEKLEDWIARAPEMLGEPLLVIGRQVMIPDVKDRLDLLAIDSQGRTVVIELKRGKLKDPVDIQAIRYASYIAKWGFEDIERQARGFLGETVGPDFNFNEVYEQFCQRVGVDEVPDVNTDQRMVIVGSEVKDKLGSVALWLRDKGVDITVVQVDLYREGDDLLVQPQVIVPLPVSRFADTGRPSAGLVGLRPWVTDGRAWHLDKRCKEKTRELLIRLTDIIEDNLQVDGPRWDQKFYVAYGVGNHIWVAINTFPTMLRLDFLVKTGSFTQAALAKELGVEEYDLEKPVAEKMSLPSSVLVERRNEDVDRICLRMKEDFDLGREAFLRFLKAAYKASPRQ